MHRSRAAVARTGQLLGLAMLVALVIAVSACSSSGAAPTSDPNAQGSAMVNEFFSILQQPDAAKADRLKTFLAPEFQVVRDTGDQLTKDAYLAKNTKNDGPSEAWVALARACEGIGDRQFLDGECVGLALVGKNAGKVRGDAEGVERGGHWLSPDSS